MSQEMLNQVISSLEKLGTKVSNMSLGAWEILIKGTHYKGIFATSLWVICIVAFIAGTIICWKKWEYFRDNDFEPVPIVVGIITLIIMLVFTAYIINDGILSIIYPEYIVIQNLIGGLQ